MKNVLSSDSHPTLRLYPIPAFNDNYIWLLEKNNQAVVVDPGQAKPVLNYVEQHDLRLEAILITHHHGDHVGGVDELRRVFPDATVYGPASERIPQRDVALKQDDVIHIEALSLQFQVLDIPGHTAGHIAYFCNDTPTQPLLFCGDTLFSAGCGRLFEGTPAQMSASLGKLSSLPPATLVCCAHEYTLSNLQWALEVEPSNPALQNRWKQAQAQRKEGLPTVPTTLATELETNPFIRTQHPAVMNAAQAYAGKPLNDAVNVFACLREWKNNF